MANDVLRAFSMLDLWRHVIELAMIYCELSFTDFVIFVDGRPCNNDCIGIEWVEGNLKCRESLRV
jgi:hypothetical protein